PPLTRRSPGSSPGASTMKPKLPPHLHASRLLRDLAQRLQGGSLSPRSASQFFVCLAVQRPRPGPATMAWILAGLRYVVHGSPRPTRADWLDGWRASTALPAGADAMRAAAEALDFPAPATTFPKTAEEAACLLLDNLPHRFTGQRPYTREE